MCLSKPCCADLRLSGYCQFLVPHLFLIGLLSILFSSFFGFVQLRSPLCMVLFPIPNLVNVGWWGVAL